MMRKKKSFKNVIAALISNTVTIIIGIVSQAMFIKILGTEYLGLNSLFTNVITMLSIVELGIGNAIIYNLYKPVAENNVETIKSLLSFYKKSYYLIGVVILIIGIIIIPLLPYIVNLESIAVNINVYKVYILFLIETSFSYFLCYKRSIIYADQKNYIICYIHIGYTIFLNMLQLLILYCTKNYYLYLLIKIILKILENLIISCISNKLYPYLKDKKIKSLDKSLEKDIFIKIKALFFHQIGNFIINGTDNIIISRFFGIVAVGLYSNYYFIINSVKNIFAQIIDATTASIGNLLVMENIDKQYEVFKKIRFLNFWLASFSGIAIAVMIKSFIKIWIGEQYLLSDFVLIILIINFFQKMMRNTYAAFKNAAGIFYEDRFIPVLESLLNIIFSLVFLKIFGLAGVFIGTIVSSFALWGYSYPKYVYIKLFYRNYFSYAKETIAYLILFLILFFISYTISINIVVDNNYLSFFINFLIAIFVPNIILVTIFYKNENFKYFMNLIKNKKKFYRK